MKVFLALTTLVTATVAVSLATALQPEGPPVALVQLEQQHHSDWQECSLPEEVEKSGDYDMEVQEGSEWTQAKAVLYKCNLGTNPLRLSYGGKSLVVRWPDFMEETMLFTQTDDGTSYFGLKLQVASQEYQDWWFLHLRFPDLDSINKFILGAQTHLNTRHNDWKADWKLLSDEDFGRAQDLSPRSGAAETTDDAAETTDDEDDEEAEAEADATEEEADDEEAGEDEVAAPADEEEPVPTDEEEVAAEFGYDKDEDQDEDEAAAEAKGAEDEDDAAAEAEGAKFMQEEYDDY